MPGGKTKNGRNKKLVGLHKAGVSKHANEEELEKTLDVVGHYYNRGFTYSAIVEKLQQERGVSVSTMTISGYVKQLKQRWREASVDDRQVYVQQKLAQLADLKREAWEAYEMSKQKERTVTKEFAVPMRLKDAAAREGVNEDGDRNDPGPPTKLKLLKKQVREMQRLPADRFLQIVLHCIEVEIGLLGIEAPKEVKVGMAGDKKVLDWTVHSNSLPPARDIEAELKRVKDEMEGVIDAEVEVRG